MTELCRNLDTLRGLVAGWRTAGETIAVVPTMGALHAGHMELIRAARLRARRTIVTIFVNPTQFAPNEDFAAYPRDLEGDRALVAREGADLIYAPEIAGMYPDGFATRIEVGGPAKADLEDRFRPTHFSGVATIVTKLLMQTQPDLAFFGEKDFQQLKMIERMVADLDIPVEVVPVPIVREADGLALSSRNAYLSADERARAPELHAALAACADSDAPLGEALDVARRRIEAAGFVIDYVEARDATSLAPLAERNGRGRLLAAARLGKTRLIDNVEILSAR